MMNNPPKKSGVRRIWVKILLGLLGLFLLGWFVLLVLNLISKNSLNRYERQEEAQGEHFALIDFVPKAVPDDKNFALTPVVASSYERDLDKTGHPNNPKRTDVVNRLDMSIYGPDGLTPSPTNGNWSIGRKTDLQAFQAYYRALAAKRKDFPVAVQAQSPAADVLLALSKYDATLQDLRQAATLPDSRFPVDYDNDFPEAISFPHLTSLRKCSKVLQLRAVAELHNHQSDLALADVKLMIHLMWSINNEPCLLSPLVRIDLLNLTLQPVWEGIQDHLWSNAQLAELNGDFAQLDFLADYESSVRGDRAFFLASIEYLRRSRSVRSFFGEPAPLPMSSEIMLRFSPDSVFYQNELLYAQAVQDWVLPVVNVQKHSISIPANQSLEANVNAMRINCSLNNLIPALELPIYENVLKRFGYAQSSVDMARVACALERFWLAKSEYPETLDELAPQFITSLPSDIIGGQSLKYHRTEDGRFILYSVGWNDIDEGGTVYVKDPSKRPGIDYEQGDWVWSGQIIAGH